MDINHYDVLGLPSDRGGVSLQEINKAYRLKAIQLHPDKRPNDPNAHADFVELQNSYEVLKDEKARKLFDDQLRIKREHDFKRRMVMADLEKRREEAEERMRRKLNLINTARIRKMAKLKAIYSSNKPAFLEVSWKKKKIGGYTNARLREIFGEFGGVESVIMKRCWAVVVMASKDDGAIAIATAATGRKVLGDPANPLFVRPLRQQEELMIMRKMLRSSFTYIIFSAYLSRVVTIYILNLLNFEFLFTSLSVFAFKTQSSQARRC